MSYSIKLEKLAKERNQSRQIANEILSFGVNENQKLDIIFELSMNLENNKAMKEIIAVLKKYRENINKEEETEDNNDSNKSKIIIN
jgi:DNA-directed RNA polymerase subunit F